MTLKEKFDNVEIMFENQTGILKYDELYEASNQCEKIADDYAIEFLDFAKSETDYDLWETKFDYKGVLYTSKELLEIFKKEKGL